jgi:alkanesulfonate monooxygenase SsuD/methylene tetrahydromethanopterin reductase-like flavin-dependent oxidoreductase (luciferase family)
MRVGVELLLSDTADAGLSWEGCRAAAVAAETCGFDAVWLAGEKDPVTLAGALAAATTTVTLGVICRVGAADRNPSVLARDLTAVDVLSSGRTAVVLEGPAGPTAEAAQVCRLLFAGGEVHHEGPRFHLDGAVNLPPPVGSPQVFVHSPEPPNSLEGEGWVTSAALAEVSRWRRQVSTMLLWRGSPGGDPQALAAGLFDLGIDGLILECPATAAEVTSLARQLSLQPEVAGPRAPSA